MAESAKTESDLERERIIAVVLEDIQARGSCYLAIREALRRDIFFYSTRGLSSAKERIVR